MIFEGRQANIQKPEKTSRIAKGSFGPTFANSSEDETSGIKEISRKRKHAAGSPEKVEVDRSEGLHTSKQRKHAAGSPERVEVCRAREGYHPTHRCYSWTWNLTAGALINFPCAYRG